MGAAKHNIEGGGIKNTAVYCQYTQAWVKVILQQQKVETKQFN